MKRRRIALQLALSVLILAAVLFPILKSITGRYEQDLYNALHYDSITHIKNLSEYLNSHLKKYEFLLKTAPNLVDFEGFLELIRKDATWIQEIYNIFLLSDEKNIEGSLHPIGPVERGLSLEAGVPFSCFLRPFNGKSYLVLSQRYPTLSDTRTLVVILRTLVLLPDHVMFPYRILGISLWDKDRRSMILYDLPYPDTSFPGFSELLENPALEVKRLGTLFQEDLLFRWDSLRDYPLRIGVSVDIQKIKAEVSRYTLRVIGVGYIAVIVLYILLFSLIRYILKTQRQERELKMKEMILRESNHRIKNNIQALSSLLSLQRETSKEPGVQMVFSTAISRLQVIALLHEELYREDSLKTVNVKNYLEKILESLAQLYGTRERNIRLHIDLDPDIHLHQKRAQACGFVIHELVINAIKHAFPDGREGTVQVRVKKKGDSVWVEVEDNGVGLPTGGKEADKSKGSEGLGMDILHSMADDLRGRFTVDGTSGMKARVVFPLQQIDSPVPQIS